MDLGALISGWFQHHGQGGFFALVALALSWAVLSQAQNIESLLRLVRSAMRLLGGARQPEGRLAWLYSHWPLPGPVLLFLDEVRDPADLQAMGRGLPERFRLLVTSRRQFGTASQWVPLEPLDEIKAVELLAAVSERGPFSHEPAISEAEAQVAWVEQSQAVMVAVDALW